MSNIKRLIGIAAFACLILLIVPESAHAAALGSASVSADTYAAGASATYTFTYTTATTSPNMILYAYFPTGFNADALGSPLNTGLVTVTVNGVSKSINSAGSWGIGRSFVVRLTTAADAPGGSVIVVTANGIVNHSTPGSYSDWLWIRTADSGGNEVDGWPVTPPAIVVTAAGGGGNPAAVAEQNMPLSVTLASPNGGESLKAGTRHLILWNTRGTRFHRATIQLSTNGGNSYPVTLMKDGPGNGSFDWVVPQDFTTTSRAKIRVLLTTLGSEMASDSSDADFSIVGVSADTATGSLPKPGMTELLGPIPLHDALSASNAADAGRSPSSRSDAEPGLPGAPEGFALTPPSAQLEGFPRLGDAGPAVEVLKDFLTANGFPAGDGDAFDVDAQAALIQFQIEHSDSGTLDAGTLRFINSLLSRKAPECRVSFLGLIPPVRLMTKALQPGDAHADVKVLQKFLNDNGFLLASRGPGSPGVESERFLALTERALARFQAEYGLLSEKGGIGPKNKFFLENLSADPTVLPCPALMPPVSPLTRVLRLGMRGDDVRVLQRFLNDNGYALAVAGPGSKGQETTSYLSLTRAALTRFQAAYGLSAESGSMGVATRAFLNALIK